MSSAALVSTSYDLASGTISMIVNLTIQGQTYQIPCQASEIDLITIASNDGDDDWDSNTCRTFASQAFGLTVN